MYFGGHFGNKTKQNKKKNQNKTKQNKTKQNKNKHPHRFTPRGNFCRQPDCNLPMDKLGIKCDPSQQNRALVAFKKQNKTKQNKTKQKQK